MFGHLKADADGKLELQDINATACCISVTAAPSGGMIGSERKSPTAVIDSCVQPVDLHVLTCIRM